MNILPNRELAPQSVSPPDRQPDVAVRQFLKLQPIVLLLDDFSPEEQRRLMGSHVQMAARLHYPLLVKGPPAITLPSSAPADLFLKTSLPLAGLINWAACVILPGDGDSLSLALHRGCPVLVLPAGQAYLANAALALKLGVGAAMAPDRLSPEGLERVLVEKVLTPGCRRRAEAVATQLQAGRSLPTIVELLSRPARQSVQAPEAWQQIRRDFERRFRTRNRYEQAVIEVVVWRNEYNLAGVTFEPDDVVIDVGAHLGAFGYLAHLNGSRSIHCYEPEPQNYRLMAQALAGLPGLHSFNQAVFRSDLPVDYSLAHSGYQGDNTGGGNVLMAGRSFHPESQQVSARAEAQRVPVAPLDDILTGFERVALLKLDCEGSEFPILLTSRRLDRVERIMGEYHEIEQEAMACLAPPARLPGYPAYTARLLAERLASFGFRVNLFPSAPHIGRFEARRP